jgi:stage II sporulation protein AB (anti-sigma F factor)
MMDRESPNRMLLEVPNLTQNVSLCRVAVAAFAAQLEFTVAEIEELKVAVSEAVTNAVLHAYDGPGQVRVTAWCSGRCVFVEVQDWGRGIEDVPRAREASFTTMPGRMGLGFVFIESLTDEMEVVSEVERGTTVRFKKCLGQEQRGDAAAGDRESEDAGSLPEAKEGRGK